MTQSLRLRDADAASQDRRLRTQLASTEEALAHSRAQWQFIFVNNPVAMWIFDRETLAFLDVNFAAIAQYGFTREEFLQMSLADVRPEDERAEAINAARQIQASSPLAIGTWRHRRKNGALIDVEVIISDIAHEGRPARLAQLHDVTVRNAIESVLRQSNERFLALAELSADWYWEQDENLRFVEVSPGYFARTGLDPGMVLGRTRQQILGEQYPLVFDELLAVVKRREPFRDVKFHHRRTEGADSIFCISGRPIFDASGTFRGYRGIGRDITAQERMREALSNSEHRTQLAMEYGKIGIWEREIASGRVHWSPNIGPMLGLAPISETTLENFLDRVHPGDRAEVEKTLDERARGRGLPRFVEHRIIRPDGSVRWISQCGSAVSDATGSPVSTIGIMLDVTERKETEAALRKSEDMFRQLAQNIPQLFWISDPAVTRVIYVSPAFERMWGLSEEHLYRNPECWRKRIHPGDMERIDAFIAQQVDGKPAQVEFRLLPPGGKLKWMWAESFPFVGSRGERLVSGIVTDVTDRKEREEARLLQAHEHRDALVGEVHHRIKNSLQGLVGLLRKHALRHPEFADLMQGVITQIQSVAIIHGLQARPDAEGVALPRVLQAIVRMVEGVIGSPILLSCSDDGRLLPQLAEGESVAIALVLNELILNAAKHSAGAEPRITVSLARRGAGVCLDISNPGRLPPGFETRPLSTAGTGLGLVCALLPRQGATLSLENVGDTVRTLLFMNSPVIEPEQAK